MRCQSLHVLLSTGLIGFAFVIASTASAQVPARDLRKTALKSATPSDEIIRIDIDHDGRPDIIERWWNGKRVRWLDENGDMLPTDTRGDQVADVLQVDKNGDGLYDGPLDLNVKWADNDGDGKADMQAWVTQPPEWGPDKFSASEAHWMISSTSKRMACLVISTGRSLTSAMLTGATREQQTGCPITTAMQSS